MAFTKAIPAVSVARILAVLAQCDITDETLLEMIQSEAVPMRSKGSSIVVGIEGGLVTGFSFREMASPDDFEVLIADYDVQGADESEIVEIHCPDGDVSRALITDENGDFTKAGAAFVDAVSDAYDKHRASEEEDEAVDSASTVAG